MKPTLITIIITTETVPMIHAVAFWHAHGGLVGWLWAPVSLVVTLFFWFTLTGPARYIAGTAASVLLLAAPLYQVAEPLAQRAAATDATQTATAQRLETLRNEIATLNAQRETYAQNSATRQGWLEPITQTNARIAELQTEQYTLTQQPNNAEQPIIIAALQLAALVLFHAAAVVAITKLRCNSRATAETPAQHPVATVATPETTPPKPATQTETLAQRIARGDYGQTPSVRQIMASERLRHPAVAEAFRQLTETGTLTKRGQRYTLA